MQIIGLYYADVTYVSLLTLDVRACLVVCVLMRYPRRGIIMIMDMR